MTKYRSLMERDLRRIGGASFSFDQLHGRRLHKQRRQRVQAAVVGLLVAALALGALLYTFAERSVPRPAAPGISAANVADLRLLQTIDVGGRVDATAEADGRVYVRARNGAHDLLAFSGDCGGPARPCHALWGADVPKEAGPATAGLSVSAGTVYAAGDRLRAFPAFCTSVCIPRWTSTPAGRSISAVAAGDVVVTVEFDHLAAFPADCAPVHGACHPLWVSTRFPTHLSPFVTVSGDRVYVGSITPDRNGPGLVYTLPLRCRTDGGECARSAGWQPPAPAGYSITASDGRISMGTAVDGFQGGLRVYPSSCFATARCQPVWTARAPGALNSPAPVVSDAKVFVFSNFGAAFAEAFPASCDSKCQPVWRAFGVKNMSPTSPVVSGGVLYVASLTDGLKAFPTDCAAACVPAWTWSGPNGIPTAIRSVAATHDRVFAGGADGNLYVFGPSTPSRVSSSGASNAVAVVLYAALAIVLVAALALRSRRRVRSEAA